MNVKFMVLSTSLARPQCPPPTSKSNGKKDRKAIITQPLTPPTPTPLPAFIPAPTADEYHCDGCSRVFPSSKKLDEHKRVFHAIENTKERYPCQYPGCTKTFTQRNGLTGHILVVHTTDDQKVGWKFRCECGLKRPTQYLMKSHQATCKTHAQKSGTIYSCKEPGCKKTFDSYSKRYLHFTKKHGYPCDICGKRFKKQGDLRLHGATHSSGQVAKQTNKPSQAGRARRMHDSRKALKEADGFDFPAAATDKLEPGTRPGDSSDYADDC